jgi:putative FmdB family regulatory protein
MEENLPTYDYRCTDCGSKFELRLKFSDSIEQPCPECGAPAERQFSAVPIVFKGGGWYVNDYGKKGSSSGKPSESGKSSESSSESKSDSSGESKSDKQGTTSAGTESTPTASSKDSSSGSSEK